jgi:putative transposase
MLPVLHHPVFHVYNRSNDRRELFPDHLAYVRMLNKISMNFSACAHLLAYCLMPNHFHLLLVPTQPVDSSRLIPGKVQRRQPTKDLSIALQRTLMGYAKGSNAINITTGSRFHQHTRCKYHPGPVRFGMDYIHFNPVKANLVAHPSEWGYSSFNEYSGLIKPEDCICNVQLGWSMLLASS